MEFREGHEDTVGDSFLKGGWDGKMQGSGARPNIEPDMKATEGLRRGMCLCPRAVLTETTHWVTSHSTEVLARHPGGWKSEVKVSAGHVFSEAPGESFLVSS